MLRSSAPMIVRTSLASALLAGASSLAVACGAGAPPASSPDAPCTELGCSNGFSVALAPSGGRWAPGVYAFEVTTPGGTTRCEGSLPLPACNAGASLRCSGPPVSIGESGCALPANQHGFSGIELADGPVTIAITIRKDGTELIKKSFAPAYRTVRPNGDTCEPVCRQASATLSW